jgi:hypothetical protein
MQLAVITPELRAQAFIRKGQRAWTAIKATAEEQRTLWLEVGVALMYGKLKENRPVVARDQRGLPRYQKFSDWVADVFPELKPRYVSAALWVAENSAYYAENLGGVSDPIEAQRMAGGVALDLPSDLKEAAPPVKTAALPTGTAVKVNKLHHRSTSGDEGSDIARRHLKVFADQHGLDLEALLRAAAEGDPDGRHRFSPPMQSSIDQWRDRIRKDTSEMVRGGLSIEAIKHLLINLANSL